MKVFSSIGPPSYAVGVDQRLIFLNLQVAAEHLSVESLEDTARVGRIRLDFVIRLGFADRAALRITWLSLLCPRPPRMTTPRFGILAHADQNDTSSGERLLRV